MELLQLVLHANRRAGELGELGELGEVGELGELGDDPGRCRMVITLGAAYGREDLAPP